MRHKQKLSDTVQVSIVVWSECGHGLTPLHEEYGGHLLLRPECSGGRRLVLTRPDYERATIRLRNWAAHPKVSTELATKEILDAAGDLWQIENAES